MKSSINIWKKHGLKRFILVMGACLAILTAGTSVNAASCIDLSDIPLDIGLEAGEGRGGYRGWINRLRIDLNATVSLGVEREPMRVSLGGKELQFRFDPGLGLITFDIDTGGELVIEL